MQLVRSPLKIRELLGDGCPTSRLIFTILLGFTGPKNGRRALKFERVTGGSAKERVGDFSAQSPILAEVFLGQVLQTVVGPPYDDNR